jgi:hypothetical protein
MYVFCMWLCAFSVLLQACGNRRGAMNCRISGLEYPTEFCKGRRMICVPAAVFENPGYLSKDLKVRDMMIRPMRRSPHAIPPPSLGIKPKCRLS